MLIRDVPHGFTFVSQDLAAGPGNAWDNHHVAEQTFVGDVY